MYQESTKIVGYLTLVSADYGDETKLVHLSDDGTEVAYNEDGVDVNFRFEGDTDANLIFADAGLDKVGIGTASPTVKLTVAGGIRSNSGTDGIGYGAGAGGAVTQITTIATGVTLNKTTGTITTVASTLAAAAEATFTVSNTCVAATDTVAVSTTYAGAGTPLVFCSKVAANAFDITITNLHAANALDALLVINFAVIKAINS